jgi:hypothetical protein
MCAWAYHCGADNCSHCLRRHMDATNRFAQILLGYRRQFEFIPTYSAHFTGRFLPWHRLYLHTMEGLLRDKCGYKGYMAYWDWTIGKFGNEPVPCVNRKVLGIMFCHLLSSMLTLGSVLGRSQMRAPISSSATGPFVISSAPIQWLTTFNVITR